MRHLLTVHEGREAVAPRSEVRRNGTVGGEKALSLPDAATRTCAVRALLCFAMLVRAADTR